MNRSAVRILTTHAGIARSDSLTALLRHKGKIAALWLGDRQKAKAESKGSSNHAFPLCSSVRLSCRLTVAKCTPVRCGLAKLLKLGDRCSRLPVIDNRSADEMLYDERGLPR